MAKVVGPLFSEYAQGSLSGIEFRTGLYGPMVGSRSAGPSRRTARQRVVMVRSHILYRLWNNLSESDKKYWSDSAPENMTGYQYFMQVNLRQLALERSPILRPLAARPWPKNFKATVVYRPMPTNRIVVNWPLNLDFERLVLPWYCPVWTPRKSINRAKYIQWVSRPLASRSVTILLPYAAPYYWILVEGHDSRTGVRYKILEQLIKTS